VGLYPAHGGNPWHGGNTKRKKGVNRGKKKKGTLNVLALTHNRPEINVLCEEIEKAGRG